MMTEKPDISSAEKAGSAKCRKGILFLTDLVFVILSYGVFFREVIGGDSVFFRYVPEANLESWADNGRYFTSLLNRAIYNAGIMTTDYVQLNFVIFLVAIAASLYLTQETFFPLLEERIVKTADRGICCLILSLVYVNVLFTEFFYFCVCYLSFPFAFFFSALGCFLWVRKKYVPAVLSFVASCLFYQAVLFCGCMILSAWYVLQDDFKLSAKLVWKVVRVNLILGMIGVLDMLSTSLLYRLGLLFEVEKTINVDPEASIRGIAEGIKDLLSSSLDLLPSCCFPLMILAVSCIIIITGLIRKKNYSGIITFLLLILLTNGLVYTFPFMQGGQLYPRVVVLFYSMMAMLLLCAFTIAERKGRFLLGVMTVCFMLLQVVTIHLIAADGYISKALDLNYANAVIEKIDQYEEKSGNKVSSIAIGYDTRCLTWYTDIGIHRDQINERVMAVTPYSMLRWVYGFEHDMDGVFAQESMDDTVFEKYFDGKNWDYMDLSEQLVFEGSNAYLCIY